MKIKKGMKFRGKSVTETVLDIKVEFTEKSDILVTVTVENDLGYIYDRYARNMLYELSIGELSVVSEEQENLLEMKDITTLDNNSVYVNYTYWRDKMTQMIPLGDMKEEYDKASRNAMACKNELKRRGLRVCRLS